MKQNKTDVRSRMTRKLICDSLLKELAKKRLKDITVAELCAEAQVNRCTFYNHFYDIYDLYEYIEQQFYNEVLQKFDTINVFDPDYQFFKEIMLLISQNADFSRIILSNINESALMKNVIEYIKGKYIANFCAKSPSRAQEEVEALFAYITNGSIGMIIEWLRTEDISPHVFAERIHKFNTLVIKGLLEK